MRGANAPSVNALTLGLMVSGFGGSAVQGSGVVRALEAPDEAGIQTVNCEPYQGSGISALRTAAKSVVARHATAREESAQSLKRVATLIDPGQPGVTHPMGKVMRFACDVYSAATIFAAAAVCSSW